MYPTSPSIFPWGDVQMNLMPAAESTFLLMGLDETLGKLLETPAAPTERAAQVDHYLYGTAKQP